MNREFSLGMGKSFLKYENSFRISLEISFPTSRHSQPSHYGGDPIDPFNAGSMHSSAGSLFNLSFIIPLRQLALDSEVDEGLGWLMADPQA
jgi:hypothetical protein